MYTLCVILANGMKLLIDTLRAGIALTMLKILKSKGAKVTTRYWA